MDVSTRPFHEAYASYYSCIRNLVRPGMKILEVGGGHHPSFDDWSNFDYTIIDPDRDTLKKCQSGIHTICSSIEEVEVKQQYDMVISKMVLEHIEHPEAFHRKIRSLVKPTGNVIHFFACRNSLPSMVNRILPEWASFGILRLLGNRKLEASPKYKAYYRMVDGHTKQQLSFFTSMGYTIRMYSSFVGHKYFRNFPVLNQLEQWYSNRLLRKHDFDHATAAWVWLQPS